MPCWFGKSKLIPNRVYLRKEVINGLSGFLAHAVKLVLKLILMGKTSSLVSFFQKIPDVFRRSSYRVKLKAAKLKTDRGNRGITKPGNDLVILTVPFLKSVFISSSMNRSFSSGTVFYWFSHIPGDNSPELLAFEERGHSLGPQNIV
ncbi:hypothetical protein CsSME_00020002 [Camellia sinensis var. sinensis]